MQILTAQDAIAVQNNQLVTTSLKVAEAFNKRHKHVLEKIQGINCSDEFTQANFSTRDQKVNTGNGGTRWTKVYEMTKDGFMFLVMGFTGKKAAQIKEAYINAFNEMAEKLNGTAASPSSRKRKALPDGLSTEQQDAIKALVKARVEALAPQSRAKGAITCWSALKSKFGCTYKEIDPECFTDAVSLVARVPLQGEYLEGELETATLTDKERSALHCLNQHLLALDKDFQKSVGPAVRSLNAGLYHDMREHLFIAKRQCQMIEHLK